MKGLRLGQKMGIGFGIVIALMLTLGSIATISMFGVRKESHILKEEYLQQVALSAEVERSVRQIMFAIRAYALSGETTSLEEGFQHLEAVKQQLQMANTLAEASPGLEDFREVVPRIQDDITTYEQLVQKTQVRNQHIADARQTLNATAVQYLQSCHAFLTNQNNALKVEIIAGFAPEKLIERQEKITLINTIINLNNEIRVATFKGQAVRDLQLVRDAQANFEQMEQIYQKLLALTVLTENIAEIETSREAAGTYQAAMDTLLEEWTALQQLDEQRLFLAEEMVERVRAMAAQGIEHTDQVAASTVASLFSTSIILMIGLLVAAVIGIGTAVLISSGVLKQLGADPSVVVDMVRQVAEGDLIITFKDGGKRITGLYADIQRMVTQLRDIVGSVKGAADNVTDGSQTMSSSAEEMSNGAAEQAAAAEEASSSMEEMAANIRQNADNAMQTEKIAIQAAVDAQKSGEAVAETVDAMKEIVRQISVIEEIARQTHTLSLNATIEAAKAEQYGKGFAVVASEVRALASRSQTAASEINAMTGSSIAVAEKAGVMLEKLVPDIQKTAELVQEINAASREQSTGTQQINRAIQQLDSVTQQNSATSEELSATAEELASQAEMLQQAVMFFKIAEDDCKVSEDNRDQVSPKRAAVKIDHSIERPGDERDDEFERY